MGITGHVFELEKMLENVNPQISTSNNDIISSFASENRLLRWS
jgi:hypothetical protein